MRNADVCGGSTEEDGSFSADGLVIVNSQGIIVQSNQQMQELFACSVAELSGVSVSSLFPGNRPIDFEALRPASTQARRVILAIQRRSSSLSIMSTMSPLYNLYSR